MQFKRMSVTALLAVDTLESVGAFLQAVYKAISHVVQSLNLS